MHGRRRRPNDDRGNKIIILKLLTLFDSSIDPDYLFVGRPSHVKTMIDNKQHERETQTHAWRPAGISDVSFLTTKLAY